MKNPLRLILLAQLWVLPSCTTLFDPAEIHQLPQSSGIYGGSWLFDPWVYRGADLRGHHFTYSWHRDNIVHRKKLVFDTTPELVDLPFPLSVNDPKWKAVRPVFDSSGHLTRFVVIPSIHEKLEAATR